MSKLKLNVVIGDRDEPAEYPDLDLDITADELVDKIKEDEELDRFNFKEWYNDIDQKVFVYGLDDGSLKIADLLWVQDFSEVHTIAFKDKVAKGKSTSTSSKAAFLVQSLVDSAKKKFTLMNATHEKLLFEVRYAAESQRVKHESKSRNLGVGISLGDIGGNVDMGYQSDVTKEVSYCQDLDKAEEYDLEAHCSKKVAVNKGHFTGVIYVEVFQLDKDKQKIVTRTNNEGWKMGAETISLNVGDHYIIVPGSNGEIQSIISENYWTAQNGNKYEPHGCLPKEKRCPKCDFLTQRDGWMFGKHNFNDVHPRGGLTKVNEEYAKCPVQCGFKMNLKDFDY